MFKIFQNFRGKDLAILFCGILMVAAQVGLELKMPEYMSTITRLVQTEGSEMSEILLNGSWMLLCALGSFAANVGAGFCFATASARLSMNTRKRLFNKVEDLDAIVCDVNRFHSLNKRYYPSTNVRRDGRANVSTRTTLGNLGDF